MYLIQKSGADNFLLRKFIRARNLSTILYNDLLCSLSWHLMGRFYYPKNLSTLTAKYFWCFIVGCNNSGTTILKLILDGTGAISTHRYEGQMYTRVFKRAPKKKFERIWMEYADELSISSQQHIDNAPHLLHDWLRSLPKPINNIIVEKTPANLLRMEWLQKVFPNSLFIGMVRNGYAVAEGIRRKGDKKIGRGATHWNKANKYMLERAKNINNFFLLRYEDLCDKPEKTLNDLSPMIGISSEKLLNSVSKIVDATNNGDRQTRVLKNYNYESIGRLSRDDKLLIRAKASEMLDYFDYDSDIKL